MQYIKILHFAIVTAILLTACTASKTSSQASSNTPFIQSVDSTGQYDSDLSEKVYRPERTKVFQLVHTRLEVKFNWEKRRLMGKATIDLKPYFYPQDKLKLDAKNFDVHRVAMINASDTVNLQYDYDNSQLDISLNRIYYKDEQLKIYVDYTAKPYDREAGGSSAIQSDRGLFFVNHDNSDPHKPRQIWTQGETENNSFWFPTIDTPNQRTTQEIFITVDGKYVTLSNGLLISSTKHSDGNRTDYWKLDQSHTPYLFMMAVGEFSVVKDYWNDIEVSYYVEPAYEQYAKAIFGNTPEMMTFFSEKLGIDYPWPKYAQVVVRDFVSGAMENTTASVFMEDLQIDDRELLDYHWDGIIAHELFHHWFGNLVTCESWANLPLNEAFANYSEYLWYEYKYGKDEADYHNQQELNQYLQESQSKKEDLIRFYYDDKEDMFDSHSYAKGGRILHMLRHYVGDTAFFESLKLYLNNHAYSDVEVHDLRLSFEEVTGKDLNWFFNQWFLSAGHPQIKVAHQYNDGNLKLEVWQNQDRSTTPVYQLPIDVLIYNGDKQITYSLEIKDAYQQFNLPLSKQPDLVIFDAGYQLLGEIVHEKSRDEMIFQYQNTFRFLPRSQALDYLSKDLENNAIIMLKALEDPFYILRQKAIGAFDGYKGKHVATLEEKLEFMVRNDNKSVVRADALHMLSILKPNAHQELFLHALNDSSYSVLGVALMAISDTNIKDKDAIFSRYEDLNNLNVFLPIASYYARQGKYNKYNWFDQKLSKLHGTDLWYMLQFFGEYLMNAPEEQKQKGVKILAAEAKLNKSYYIRLAAYQALGLLEGVDGVEQIMEDVRKSETDTRLNRIYSNLN